jgi:hypothetical protein
MVLAGPVMWPMENSPQLLRFYREWIRKVPEELTTIVTFRRVLPLPSIPEELHGRHVVIVGCCYAGLVEEGERVLRPLREFGSPLADGCALMPFVAHQASLDPGFPHDWWYGHPALPASRRSSREGALALPAFRAPQRR